MRNSFFLFLILSFINLNSQTEKSFQDFYNTISQLPAEEQIEKLSSECWENRSKNPFYALDCAREAIKLARKIGDNKNLAQNLNFIGVVYRNIGNFPKALQSYQEALDVAVAINDSVQIAYSYNNIGGIYRIKRQFTPALSNIYRALNIFEALNDKRGIAYCTINIGIIYRLQENYNKAFEYLNRTVEIREEIGDDFGKTLALNQLAELFYDNRQYNKAETYYNQLLTFYTELEDKKGIAAVLGGLASIHNEKGEYEKALNLRSKALDISKEINNLEGITVNLNNLAIIHTQLGNYIIANSLLKESFNIVTHPEPSIYLLDYYLYKSKYHEIKNENDSALAYYKKFHHFKDSLAREENIATIANLEALYQTEKAIEEKESTEKESELRMKQRNYLFFIALLLVLFAVYLTYKFYRNKRVNRQLRELNATKDKLFSIVAHDLKNPFNSLIGYSEILLDDSYELSERERKNAVAGLNAASRRLVKLVENLLEWARNNLGSLKFSPSELNLFYEVKSVLNSLDNLIKEKNITVETKIEDPTFIFCDEHFLNTVIRNLLSNSIKFNFDGGKITLEAVEKNNFVEFSIIDNGVGISEEKQRKLFKVGEEITTEGTAMEKGTGLGLILSNELVSKWGGKIKVESEEEKGSKFTVTIPVKSAP